jgi:hypothetical protein
MELLVHPLVLALLEEFPGPSEYVIFVFPTYSCACQRE